VRGELGTKESREETEASELTSLPASSLRVRVWPRGRGFEEEEGGGSLEAKVGVMEDVG